MLEGNAVPAVCAGGSENVIGVLCWEGVKCNGSIVLEGNVPAVCAGGL